MKNSVHYEAGSKNEIAVVLSCPGREEELACPQGPAKGQTGKNLETLLEILTRDYEYSGFTRSEICVTNAWDKVEYKKKTGKSEAKLHEILSNKNLDRLAKEVGVIEKLIICCGVNAKAAILSLSKDKKINSNAKIVFLDHLGNQSLNSSIKFALDGSKIKSYSNSVKKPAGETRSLKKIGNENRILRLQVVAKRLNEQIQIPHRCETL